MNEMKALRRVVREMKTPPDRLWLQFYRDAPVECDGDVSPEDVSWCTEKIFPRDVEYLRVVPVDPLLVDVLLQRLDDYIVDAERETPGSLGLPLNREGARQIVTRWLEEVT